MNRKKDDLFHYHQQYESIDSADRILSILKPLSDSAADIKLIPDNSKEVFYSVLQLEGNHLNRLTIKNIPHSHGHLTILDAKTLTIHSQHNGADVTFSAQLLPSSQENGYYRVNFPSVIKYCQRRMSHRIHISYALDVTASFIDAQGQKFEGYLRDLSTDGMRLQLSKINPGHIQERTLIKNCTISFPDRIKINCDFEIRHKHNHVRNQGCTIGGSFYGMSTEEKKEIRKFIAGLERKTLREIRV